MELPSAVSATTIGSAAVLCFLVANAKALPLAYTINLLPSLYRLFKPRLIRAKTSKSKNNTPSDLRDAILASTPALFRHHTTRSRAVALDLDVNMHKSNSTFFVDADISRAALLTKLLSGALAGGNPLVGEGRPAMFILAGVQCRFAREIPPFAAYEVLSRVLAWDERSMYVVTYFLRSGTARRLGDVEIVGGPGALLKDEGLRRGVFAVMVAKYVFKAGRMTVLPRDVLVAAGLLVPGDEKDVDVKRVGDAVKNGLQYVRECML